MASTGIYDQSYQLDSNQQDLLLAALASNQPNNKSINRSDLELNQDPSNPMAADPYQTSPQSRRTPGSSGMEGSLESPFIDYEADYDFDGTYDFPEGEMIGSIPGTSGEHELHDKRKSFDGEEDDDEGGGKRQETDEKSSKKPGRKPLVTEPTTKRKAQNRAAQRAFRERKEKHLKDLETKVSDLEKASESANHENSMLRSQVDRLQTELQEYRKRVTLSGVSRTPPSAVQARDSWTSGNDFQFDFPVFGTYPFPPTRSKSNPTDKPGALNDTSSSNGQPVRTNSYGSSPTSYRQPLMNTPVSSTGVEAFSELFSPSILAASVSMSPASDYNSHKGSVDSAYNGNRADSLDNSHSNNSVPTLNGGSSISNSASPSASSVSQHGPGSSCGTSPEPTVHSPANNKGIESNLKTINEENTTAAPSSFMIKTPSAELNGIDWLAQQNGGQFNPDLFGDYRESQDAVGTADFGGFFNEAFPLPDFGSPLQTYDTTSPAAQKANILEVMDKKKDEEVLPVMPREKATPDMLSMNKIWDHIQNDKKYQSGDCDIDGLCKEMTKKARCTESGLLVKKEDVDKIMARQKPDSK